MTCVPITVIDAEYMTLRNSETNERDQIRWCDICPYKNEKGHYEHISMEQPNSASLRLVKAS